MRSSDDLFPYQRKAVNIQCTHTESALWLDMGLGKSVITLTSIAHLINCGYLTGVLIVAPIRVCRLVWRQESLKWNHTNHLTFSMLVGTKDQRSRALLRKADVYLTNYENLRWLAETVQTYFVSKGRQAPFDGIVFDEISKCKNSSTNRVKAFLKIKDQFKWSTGLTGTPAANGYADLHGQYLVLDGGKRLGTSKTAFKNRFYYKSGPYKYKPYGNTESEIETLIGDITLQMSAADYNPLPDMVVNDVMVDLEPSIRAKYDTLERDFFFYLDSGEGVEVFNAASLTNKCIAEGTEILTENGWVKIEKYQGERVWDGDEWVNTDGLLDQGYKNTVLCWGVHMTPDHKVFTNQGWRTAEEILDGESCKRYDRYEVRIPNGFGESREQTNKQDIEGCGCIMESEMRLRKRVGRSRYKFKNESSSNEVLWVQAQRSDIDSNRFAWNDGTTTVGVVVQHEIKVQQPKRQRLQKLWRAWNKGLRTMEQLFSELLGRHGGDVQGRIDYRAHGQQRKLHTRELPLEKYKASEQQSENQCLHRYSDRKNNCCTSSATVQNQTNYTLQAIGKRVVWRETTVTSRKRVFDIVNAGPRHRFTVRGKDGQIFISHNCLQLSNGAVYPIPGMSLWESVHDQKLDALEDIIEEANGQQILCAYAYRSDAERIMQRFKHLRPINLTECKSEASLRGAMARWKDEDCPLMIGHPASMGHGVDGLQDKGHIIVWFGLNWSLDLYEQFNARVRRQGQGVPVICHRILTHNTLDQAQMEALDEKATTQNALRAAVKRYRDGKR